MPQDTELLSEKSSAAALVAAPTSTSPWPPNLTLDIEPVLRLFTGENFYSSADAALREAILNAIDAIGRRRDFDASISPQIDLIFDRDRSTLMISDNGDGMDRNDLTNLFAKIGASASRLHHQSKRGRSAIGEFGIGALSYFLVCERYQIHTLKDGGDPIGLEFSDTMLDGKTTATDVSPTRTHVGTSLVLSIKAPALMDMLIAKFPHWLRNVDGLIARVEPEGKPLSQGGLTRKVHAVPTSNQPDWIEEACIGPPEELSIWESYDGKGRVDVLYRGVFVERAEVDGLWAIEGAIHVNPKHFRPKLNREGFVGQALTNEITPFLRAHHPIVLREAVKCIHSLLESRDDWSANKVFTLWLAVPRSNEYKIAADAWDAEFRSKRAFRLLSSESDREVSIAELLVLKLPKIYLAPDRLDKATDITRHAIRVLRARNEAVIQGLQRDTGYLNTVSIQSSHTSWLILHVFNQELPQIQSVEPIAEQIVTQESVGDVYTVAPQVKIVRLGPESAPIVSVKQQIWINVDSEKGKLILEEVFRRNEGHLGLVAACMMHAPEQGDRLNQIGALLRDNKPAPQRLGLVRRQYLRRFLG